MAQMSAIVDKLLSNVSSMVKGEGCVAEAALPSIQSKGFTGKLAKYGTNHLRIENTIIGGEGKFRRVKSITRSQSSYEIEGHGLEGMVTKADYANVEAPYDAEKDETMGVSSILLLEKEKGLADQLTSSSTITQYVALSGSDKFSDYDNSSPLDVFSTARGTVRAGCSLPPNVAIMDWAVADKLRYHPQILDALGFKDNRPGGLTDLELASAMGVKKLLIATAMYESAKEGQTSSLAAIWGKNIVFAVLPDSAQPYQVSLGYRVQLAGEQPRKVTKQAVFNPDGATAILVSDYYDMFLSNTAAAYLIQTAIV